MKRWLKVSLIFWVLIFNANHTSFSQIRAEVRKNLDKDSVQAKGISNISESLLVQNPLVRGGVAGASSGYLTKLILTEQSKGLQTNSPIKSVIILPESDEDYKAIFGKELTVSKKIEIAEIGDLAKKYEIPSVKTKQELEDYISKYQKYPINIIGHSEPIKLNSKSRGYKLVDGTVSIQDLDLNNNRITHLSCLSGDCSLNPGLPKKITYREALKLNNHLNSFATKMGISSLETSLPKGFLKEAIDKVNLNKYLPGAVGATIGISSTILPIWNNSNENLSPTSKFEIDQEIEKVLNSKKTPEKGN